MIHGMGLNNNIFNKWHGGINKYVAADKLAEGESPEISNFRVTNPGELDTRAGVTQRNTTGHPSTVWATSMIGWDPNNANALLLMDVTDGVTAGGEVYKMALNGVVTAKQALTSSYGCCFEKFRVSGQDFVFYVNGVDGPYRYNPVTDLSQAWPTSAPPATCTILKSWHNFMVATGDFNQPTRVYFSALNNAQSWTIGTDFIDIGSSEEGADPITWVDVLGNDLIVFKRNSVWRMTAGPPTPVVTRISGVGCWDRFQSAELNGRLYFWSDNSVWSLDARTDPAIQPVRHESQRVETDWVGLDKVAQSLARVMSYQNRLYVCVDLNTEGQRSLWEFDPSLGIVDQLGTPQGAWYRQTIGPTAITPFFDTTGQFRTLIGSFPGKLGTMFSGTTDFGVAIQAVWISPIIGFSDLEFKERLRRLNILLKGYLQTYVFTEWTDWDTGTAKFTGVFQSPSTGTLVGMVRARPEVRAREFQLAIYAFPSAQQITTVYSVEAVVRGRREH